MSRFRPAYNYPVPKIQAIANRLSDAVISDIRLVPFTIDRPTTINRVTGYVAVKESGKLMEIGIYREDYTKITTTEQREIPEVGDFEFAIPETTLQPGIYYFVLTSNSTVAQFGVNQYFGTNPVTGGLSATAVFPLPSTITSPTGQGTVPAATIKEKNIPQITEPFEYSEGSVRVYGINPSNAQPYGWNTATGKICRSINNGETWEDLMPLPNMNGAAICDIIVTGGKIYVFTNRCTLFVSSDLTASATWTDISCPTTAGLRHPQAVGRPYGIAAFNGYIFIGEYSQSPNEFAPDGPRILRYEIATQTWTLSKEFTGGRHIHSFYVQGSVALYVSIGDAGYGSDVGIHRLTPAQIVDGGPDTWTKWTALGGVYTNYYPVDFLLGSYANSNPTKAAPGLYCTSDRPGKHLLYCKITGNAGQFNLSAQIFQRPGGPSGETVRSLVEDPTTGNLYYWTAETTEQALYVSPPPYTQAIKLKDFPASPKLFLSRSVKSGNYIMMFNQRFKTVKFPGQ